jgi:hypothetical protein
VNDVTVYVSSVANPRKHSRKIECLESFAEGVKNSGHSVKVEWDYEYRPSRLAVILGWATTNTGGRNITLRKQIIAGQQGQGLHTMCIDGSCWKYLDDAGSYLRYSLGGPFYDKAQYANANSGPEKWNQISRDLGITLTPEQTNSQGYILICMQRDGGFAMKTLDPITWLRNKIVEIRRHTTRTIMVRPHPGAYDMADFAELRGKHYRERMNTHIIDPEHTTLADNIAQAHSAVFFNSSAAVAAVCQGVPIFVDDSSCVAWDVANKDISMIEAPRHFDRQQWIWNLAAAHWSDQENRQGDTYRRFLPYLI